MQPLRYSSADCCAFRIASDHPPTMAAGGRSSGKKRTWGREDPGVAAGLSNSCCGMSPTASRTFDIDGDGDGWSGKPRIVVPALKKGWSTFRFLSLS